MDAFHEQVRAALPGLTAENHQITSPATWEYNCVAWAAGQTTTWWWPVPGRYWPPDVPREESIPAFIAAFALLGYSRCSAADLEPTKEKVALYARGGTPTHAARQLNNGKWTSKLGPSLDVEHSTLDALAGGAYGQVVAILSRDLLLPNRNLGEDVGA